MATEAQLRYSEMVKKSRSKGVIDPDGLPSAVDWRLAGAVTPVQDQGNCNSCWAFGVAAAIEGVNYLTTGKLIKLSEQQLLDGCAAFDYNCKDGGFMEGAILYASECGLVPADDYKYMATQGDFKHMKGKTVRIAGWYEVKRSEYRLKKAVSEQPVAVCFRVPDPDKAYIKYKSGIISGPNYHYDSLNHCACIVGYGKDEDGRAYWIVKDSGGEDFGMNGFVHVARGQNALGIANNCVVPMKVSTTSSTICQIHSADELGLEKPDVGRGIYAPDIYEK